MVDVVSRENNTSVNTRSTAVLAMLSIPSRWISLIKYSSCSLNIVESAYKYICLYCLYARAFL